MRNGSSKAQRRCAGAIASLVLLPFAFAASRPPAPTHLRARDFSYNADTHSRRFVFEWDAAKMPDGKPYQTYALSRTKGCSYQRLNAADVFAVTGGLWVLRTTGPRYGVAITCRCTSRNAFYVGRVATRDVALSAWSDIEPENIELGHRWPNAAQKESANRILLGCN